FGSATHIAPNSSLQGQVILHIAENPTFVKQEFNRAFVLMQYFGYLRRDPNAGPDVDYTGYEYWLNKLNQYNGDFVQAEMVKAFIDSGEYRRRFGQCRLVEAVQQHEPVHTGGAFRVIRRNRSAKRGSPDTDANFHSSKNSTPTKSSR